MVSGALVLLGAILSNSVLSILGIFALIVIVSKRFLEQSGNAKSGNHITNEKFVELPYGYEQWVQGVSYKQNELRRIGLGACKMLLVPDPKNQFDDTAVKVVALGPSGTREHIGFLKADTQTTVAIFQYGEHLRAKGEVLVCTGEIVDGEVGLAATIMPPGWHSVRDLLLRTESEKAIGPGDTGSILGIEVQPKIGTAEFRALELVGQAEFAGNLQRLHLNPGKQTIWVALEKVTDEFIRVRLVGGDGLPGFEVGKISKKHLPYALAYTHEGPVAGYGVINKFLDGSVSLTVGEPKWRGH